MTRFARTSLLFFLFSSFSLLPLLWVLPAAANADELASGSKTKAKQNRKTAPISYADKELLSCKPDDSADGANAEASAKKSAIANDLPDDEILARLIYSEALSTGYWNKLCQAPDDVSIMRNIGWGVMKRVQGKQKSEVNPYQEAIFARKQFATSFSPKRDNSFAKAFLCPLKSDSYLANAKVRTDARTVYERAQAISRKIIAEFDQTGIPKENKKITNFFYPQSEFFGEMRPSWAKDKTATNNKGYKNLLNVPEKPCVEFYEL